MSYAEDNLKNINTNLLGQILKRNKGTIYISQFAISSKDFEAELFKAVEADIKRGVTTKIKFVGDGPFSLREWSLFLSRESAIKWVVPKKKKVGLSMKKSIQFA